MIVSVDHATNGRVVVAMATTELPAAYTSARISRH